MKTKKSLTMFCRTDLFVESERFCQKCQRVFIGFVCQKSDLTAGACYFLNAECRFILRRALIKFIMRAHDMAVHACMQNRLSLLFCLRDFIQSGVQTFY